MTSPIHHARAAGALHPARAVAASETIAALVFDPGSAEHAALVASLCAELAAAPSPDEAIAAMSRLAEAHPKRLAAILQAPKQRQLLLTMFGTSLALADVAVRDPAVLDALASVDTTLVSEFTFPVPSADFPAAVSALRAHYRRHLWAIAAADLALGDYRTMPTVAAAISRLVHATLQAALTIARTAHSEVDDALIVVALGKTGGFELNYISDVDVICVSETDTPAALSGVNQVVKTLADICSHRIDTVDEVPLWPLDMNLRPEGRDGPLVKSLAAHRRYYARWAETWEFQALLKARPIAGDRQLQRAYERDIWPRAFHAVERDNFVADTQHMRMRVEASLARNERGRHIKLGAGGLRDVEFTVQLLQLVHARTDQTLRRRGTIPAISALSAGGYISREAAAELADAYCWLRTLEHRLQLHRMRRSHVLPTNERDLRRLARAMGCSEIVAAWRECARRVRALHEKIFYRPLLPATAQLSAADVTLSPSAASARLTAIGYRNPKAALHHIAALTAGLSRRAAIQRHLLPVMLQWFAAGPNPDQGLLAFRRLSDTLGGAHWYLKLLRDDTAVAEALARALARSDYVGHEVLHVPQAVTWLAETDGCAARSSEVLAAEANAILARHHDAGVRIEALRAIRQRELMRAALGDARGVRMSSAAAISDVTDVVLTAALQVASDDVASQLGRELSCQPVIIAMGSAGGREMSYGSDVDALMVYQPLADQAHADCTLVANRWRALLADAMDVPGVKVDFSLRPEGNAGPLVQSIAHYHSYLLQRAAPWERHALLRARIVTPPAPDAVHARLQAAIDEVRYAALTTAELRQIRHLKARMEKERLPRGMQPARHLKLGPGGLSDVEWAIQILQLQYAHAHPQLRTTSTLAALSAAIDLELIDRERGMHLAEAWQAAYRIRAAVSLALRKFGSQAAILPPTARERSYVAALVASGSLADFDEWWARTSRRARTAAMPLIYGTAP